ncbi:MAG: ribose 5-phosphate isomerase B [Lachnospiraceae bacterium]|nr:ribose 5-phosphate isomerase B [Lachnospiraceae bacterium]
MKIAIACDHGGYVLKVAVVKHLEEKGYEVTDFGCDSTDSVDYPAYARRVAETVAAGEADKGIVICTTGIGVSIVANKVRGVRCALCSEQTSARLTRMHNDANVLALGGGIVGPNLALDIVDTFLNTEFCGEEKHARRIAAIE